MSVSEKREARSKKWKIWFVFLLLLLASRFSLLAYPELTGARPQGMGGAFAALPDDANALAYNPAGLAYVRRGEFSADYGRPVLGLNDKSALSAGFAGFVLPVRIRKNLSERVLQVRD